MVMEGSTFGTITHPPTNNDVHEFQLIMISDNFDWVTANNLSEIYSLEEEYRTSSNFNFCINIVESVMTQVPLTVQCRENPGLQ